MLKRVVMNGFPLLADLVVGLVLFVGRHSLASRGYDEATVGSIVLCYGFGYVVASLLMAKIVTPKRAKVEMLGALASIVLICLLLANVQALLLVQALYTLFPLVVSLYFNAFQIYMLDISNRDARPLASTVGHFTFSWSIGYAVGPFVSSLLKTVSTWPQIYYLAALISAMMGMVLYLFRPVEDVAQEGAARPAPAHNDRPSLVVAAWVGLLAGWTGYNVIVIYWPVQAVQMGVSDTVRGMVEFAFATAQAFSALALVSVKGWHHKPLWLTGLGSLALLALALFGTVSTPVLLALGGLLYGTYLGGMWSHMAYHSMLDEEKAVRRVALNETFVGICFLIASPLSRLLHRAGTPFGPSYWRLAVVLAVGLGAQLLVAYSLLRRERVGAVEPATTA
ncbi:MAG: MFS transporter [Anaerolineae bacterium]|nr:MFS transporter [Anaerolineae bacterium]